MRFSLFCCLIIASMFVLSAAEPVRIIFDTDLGNDVDDVLALAELHAFETRGEARILAVTVTKDNRWAPIFIDMLDTFYGRPNIPIGMVKNGKTPDDGNYTRQVAANYPHHLKDPARLPDAVDLLKKTLADQPDASVVIVQVGFSTNLARLLEAPGGRELAARKVRLLSIMGGDFRSRGFKEYNIVTDIPSAQKLFRDWPGRIVASGFDIGESIAYPARNIAADFQYIEHHPVADAYRAYKPMPYDEPLWDPTAALYAIRPDEGYFGTSPAGTITVDNQGVTSFSPAANGKHHYLTINEAQTARIREAISLLVSEPPKQ